MTTTTTDSSAASTDDFAAEWAKWHHAREQALGARGGWLSINRLEWLDTEPGQFDGLPGSWWYEESIAHLAPGDGETFEPRDFELHPTGPGEVIDLDGHHIEVTRRGEGYLIRVHDDSAATLRDFRGVPAYPAEPAWAIEARFEPFAEPESVTVGAVAEGLAHVYVSPGVVVLQRNGAEHRLTAFNGKDGGLSVLFTDETSGVTTYAANRTLAIEASDQVIRDGGAVVLDFNRAVNLPCAFIDFATCPLPPAGNHLPFAVEAGEKIPYERG
ncbi:DUF1684 domain-containing protein [uncultured Williamsia sp.]|uniref:DUF1684 domain-containing protein n=1 Tax=uncultured Williamsia sp. TaxID=259311 RepID=UPI002625C218|nr:DUF1684 domain-containing protein [uncultured Williamsia sp.]